MDSFAEPRRPLDSVGSLTDVRAQVTKLESDLREKDIPLSGRIIHVSHYLPVTCAFSRRPRPEDIPSPPATPPAKASDIPPSPSVEQHPSGDLPASSGTAPTQESLSPQWTLNVRYGHSAMVSGINSLATTHEQIFVGWTGDIEAASQAVPPSAAQNTSGPSDPSVSKIPSSSLTEADKTELEGLLQDYRSRDEIDDGMRIQYVPVFVDDKDAHGHYDGYCKQSECIHSTVFFLLHPLPWSIPLPFVVRCSRIFGQCSSAAVAFPPCDGLVRALALSEICSWKTQLLYRIGCALERRRLDLRSL